jgi:hypothetical protein
MVQAWLVGAAANEPLFPKLGQRRTWLMVKKDLEVAGIPYETPEGIADFHAAGRHTHITELLRNGATLPEAKALARHSDVRTTMKYTHIGLDDQHKAVQRLPWHHNGTIPCVSNGREESPPGNNAASSTAGSLARSGSPQSTSVISRRGLSSVGSSKDEASGRVRFPPPPLT